MTRWTTVLAWSLVALAIALLMGAAVFDLGVWLISVLVLVLVGSGALIASRQPGNVTGWIFCYMGLGIALESVVVEYAEWVFRAAPEQAPIADGLLWLTSWTWIPGLMAMGALLPLLFPYGRLPSPRWRPVAWLVAGSCVLMMAARAIGPKSFDGFDERRNPFAIERLADVAVALQDIELLLLGLAMLAGAASIVVRLRRARGIERQQLKWFAYAAVVAAIGLTAGVVVWVWTAASSPTPPLVSQVLLVTSMLGLVLAIAIAILRYRLYDIDVVINRTLVYGLLTATLGLTYAGLVVVLQALLRPVSGGSDLAIVVTTLVVAALFLPARRRVQDVIDRRFNRRTYDAARTIEAFGARLREQIDLDTLRHELLTVVDETMRPARVSLWLLNRNDSRTS